MTNTPTVAIHKIIFSVVFVCAAIMASLFIYHSRAKQLEPALSPDIGLIFSAPRDIKPFKLETANRHAFSEKDFYQHWTLLFFGFTHCAKVCPTTLDMMNRAYAELHPLYPNLQVALVSVDPERDTPESLAEYTKTYNSEFIGITGKIQELRKLQSQLGIYAARDNDTPAANYQIQHTSSILLINPQGKWAGLFKYGLKPDDFVAGVKAGIKPA